MYPLRALLMALVAFVPVAGAFAAAADSPRTSGKDVAHHADDNTPIHCATPNKTEDVTFVSCGGFF